jgi:Tol biopolymer transport system component
MSPDYGVFFLRENALWQLSMARGQVAPRRSPERLLTVRYKPNTWLSLTASAGGCFVAIDHVDEDVGVLLLDTAKRTVRRRASRSDPAFSPDGRQLAMSAWRNPETEDGGEIQLLDLKTDKWRTLHRNAFNPVWSASGHEIAALEEHSDGRCGVVLSMRTGTVSFRTRDSILWREPRLSPDGRYLGLLCDLSRPKLGHTLFDRRTGKTLTRDLDYTNRLPAVVEDWSPDGRFLLCNWRIPDPENDGSWNGDEVGLASLAPGVKRWIGTGHSPRFAPDGLHILYLRPYRKGIRTRPGDLCLGPASGGPTRILASDVDAFAVAGRR